MNESRIEKSIINAKVNFTFYFIMLIMSFFSRRIFLNTLGDEFMGLTGTLSNILGMLSLAELGIGTSMNFHLYKPIRENDYIKINEFISLFGWFYRIVGTFILLAAIVVSLFFPMIFGRAESSLGLIYFVFFSFLCSSLIGYFINYRQLLLAADQRGYVVSIYLQTASIVKVIIQIILCVYFLNYYVWAIIEFSFAVIACIFLNYKIDKTYPWLKSMPSKGKVLYKKYPNIISSVRQIFVHRMKDFFLNQSDQILIFAFVSLNYVAYYGNYSIIATKFSSLFSSVMGSVEAGIGNMVAENNKEKNLRVFWELMSTRYLGAGIISVTLFYIIPPFIELWLGEKYLLSTFVLFLICVNMFIGMTRTVIDSFNHCFGQYADIWAAWTEGGINIIVTIIIASNYGIMGILLGKIISLSLIVVIWKPLYLFKDGFHESYRIYWRNTSVYYLLLGISISITNFLESLFPALPASSWLNFIYYCIYVVSILSITYSILMYFFSKGLKGFVFKLINHYKHNQ